MVSVGGTIAPGVAWSRPWGESGPLVLTKPGGFGTRSTLVDLLAEHSRERFVADGDHDGRRRRASVPRSCCALLLKAASAIDVVVYGDASILLLGPALLGTSVGIRAIDAAVGDGAG